MRIGIVVHGPNIIDTGYALKLIELIKDYGDVSVRLGGTMGRTAVIDAGLENIIDITKDSMIIELTGDQAKINAFIEMLSDYEILEIARTGIAGLRRGSDGVVDL